MEEKASVGQLQLLYHNHHTRNTDNATVPRRHLIGHERGGATPQQISAKRERDTSSDRTSVHLHSQANSETLIVGRKTAKVAAKNNSEVN
jgi:hypothetical protein